MLRFFLSLFLIFSATFTFLPQFAAADSETWRYTVTVNKNYLKSKNKKFRSERIRQTFQNHGMKSTEIGQNLYSLKLDYATSLPNFVDEVVTKEHFAEYDAKEINSDLPVTSAATLASFSACPSTPYAVQCNGFTNDTIGPWTLNPSTGMSVNEAWKNSPNSHGENVIVAILSTGANFNHTDLLNTFWTDPLTTFALGESSHGFDAYATTTVPANLNDTEGTGTALAGIIAAKANNNTGTVGIAYNAKIMVVKAALQGSLNRDKVLNSLKYVLKKKKEAGNNIRVLLIPNFFLGYSPGYDPEFVDVATQLNAQGVLIVSTAPALNSGANMSIDGGYGGYTYFPTNFQTGNIFNSSSYRIGDNNATIAVTSYSTGQNYGANTIHVSSPGEYIYTTKVDGSYTYYSGIAMSAGTAAGAAALLFSKVPTLTPSQVINALKNNTRQYASPSPFAGKSISQGALDVGLAMNFVAPPVVIPGDYNRNGCVDLADYIIWRKFQNQSVTAGTLADGNNDGLVNQTDYNIWRSNSGSGCTL
jgi:hypothetical protein